MTSNRLRCLYNATQVYEFTRKEKKMGETLSSENSELELPCQLEKVVSHSIVSPAPMEVDRHQTKDCYESQHNVSSRKAMCPLDDESSAAIPFTCSLLSTPPPTQGNEGTGIIGGSQTGWARNAAEHHRLTCRAKDGKREGFWKQTWKRLRVH
eukprot:CAMPEP_0181323856 /NCGR_PEP_ID=MMETSP1101-20121128/20027_1 /TAXON_ID=46948 /ORGANISM="Rhodomonas abbreviata, Strain Caron Lab Isolate" /LENGTH=152 /DNA_ID=CAMNT_0023431949 /DNA_START=28 /DNA_END=486 /DNA_ORIENTATION=-